MWSVTSRSKGTPELDNLCAAMRRANVGAKCT